MQGGARLKSVLLLASLVLAAALLALLLPSLLDAGKLHNQISARLTIWTGGKVTFQGAARVVESFPTIALEADGMRVSDPQHLPMVREVSAKIMRIELSPWSAMFGRAAISRLTLIEPQVTLAPGAPQGDSMASRVLTTVQATPLARLSLIKAVIGNAGDATPIVKDLDAELDLSASGAMSGKGRFSWRGESVTYSFDTGEPTTRGRTAKAPLTLSLSGPMIAATMSGDAAIADGLQINGTLDLTIPRLRAFAAWMAMPMPEGNGFGELKAAGAFRWHGSRLAFDQGSFVLDGNAAQGALAIDFGGSRPSLAGTLALQRLALTPYLTPPSTTTAPGAAAIDPDLSLLRLIDLDLRLSTAEVQAPPLTLGQTALSLHLQGGALGADFSVLAVCGGKADGRAEVNAANPAPRLRLAATATGLATKPCLEAFGVVPSPIEGATSITVDVTGVGAAGRDLLASLGGTASLTIENGQASIDLAKMFALAKRRELRGWEAVRGTPTRFASLSGQCTLDRGVAHCSSLKVGNHLAGITGSGSLDFVSGALDWRLRISNNVAGPLQRAGRLVSGLFDDVVVEGSWTDPTFRLPSSESGGTFDVLERFASLKLPY